MYFSTSATAAIFIAFTSIFSNVHAGCIERPKHKAFNKLSFGGLFRSSKYCNPEKKPDPPFDFKKWTASHTINRPTGVFKHMRPTGSGLYWLGKLGATGTAGAGRVLPTAGVFWHKPGQTGTAVSRIPRPAFTFPHAPKPTSTASKSTSTSSTTTSSTTTTTRKSFQTPRPRGVEWAA